MTRADVVIALLSAARNQYDDAINSLLYYLYDFCLASHACTYDFDTDGDGLSDRVEAELNTNPIDPSDGLVAPTIEVIDNGDGDVSVNASTSGLVHTYQLFLEHLPQSYKLSEEFQADTQAQDNLTTVFKQLGNGVYHFKAKACIEVSTQFNGHHVQCSNDYSNEVRLEVSNSAIEWPISVNLPNTQAGKQALDNYKLLEHVSLQPTVGEFRVTESGTASYNIPISVPAGITGVKPSVSLSYNSLAPDGTVALGWNLNAVSSISRCRQTKAQDGQFKGLTLSEEDRFCLDGQRLISRGQHTHNGELNGATILDEYVTEIDSQQVVYQVTKNGTKWFVIKGKDGSTKHYGTSALSRVVLHEGTNQAVTLSWMINKVEDNLGHEDTSINYVYTNEVGTSKLEFGERLLSEIKYSGNRVEFSYSLGSIRSRNYVDEARLEQRARLSSIAVKNHKGQELSTYELDFEAASNGVRLLKQVQQCRGYACRKPIKFEYNSFASDLTFDARSTVVESEVAALTMADLQGDGKPELITLVRKDAGQKLYRLCVYQGNTFQRPEELSCQNITRHDDHESVVMTAADLDQDGKYSLIVNTRSTHSGEVGAKYWAEYELSSDNLLQQKNTQLSWSAQWYMREVKLADINGDGYVDLIFKLKNDDVNLYTRVWDVTDAHFGGQTTLYTTNPNKGFDSRGDFTEKATDWQAVDLNFDGLADIIALQCDSQNRCSDDEAKRITVHYNQGTQPDNSYNKFSAHDVAYEGKIENLMSADVNGDGLVDIIYLATDWSSNDIKRWKVLINRASSKEAFESELSIQAYSERFKTGTVSEHIPPLVADLDKDGKTELYFKSGTENSWHMYEWSPIDTGMNGEYVSFEHASNNAFSASLDHEKGHYAFFADYNNDGVPDLLIKDQQGVHVKYNLGQSPTEGLLKEISQGYNNKSTISYGLMTNREIYRDLEGDLAFDAAQFEKDGLSVTKVIGAMPLVHYVKTDSPSTHNSAARNKVTYHYQGARAQFGGRGMLGFKALTTKTVKQGTNDNAGTVFTTTTRYHQAFPLTGMPYSTVKLMGNDTVISEARNSYSAAPVAQKGSTHSYRVFNALSRECSAIVNTDLSIDIHTCTKTNMSQDAFANVTKLNVNTYKISDAYMHNFVASGTTAVAAKSVLTINEYGDTDEYKKYGRLTHSTVTTKVPNRETITRSSDFSYYPKGAAGGDFHLMLFEEVIGKGLGCEYELTKRHSYDRFGNQIKLTTSNSGCSAEETETRTTESFYSADGRYVNYTEQSSSKTGTLKIRGVEAAANERNAFGSPTKTKDVHSVVRETQFDAFGGAVGQYTSTGAQSLSYYSACEDGDVCAAQFNKEVNGELVEVQYLDRLGRVYRTSQIDVTGQWLSHTTKFDVFGRVIEVQSPGAQSVTTYYDVLDRVIKIHDANNDTITSSVVNGLSSTTTVSGTDFEDQTKASTSNILGEVVSATENNGQAVEFAYYADGSKKEVISLAESATNASLMSVTYDALGRKASQKDADRGDWSYTYNAFGELITQTDARGVVLTNTYDGFGRKVKQAQFTPNNNIVDEGASEWVYGDTADTAHLLIYTKQGEGWQQHYYYDTFGRSAAVLTSLDNAQACDTKVTFNSLSNDLRITDDAMANPLISKCVIQQTAYDQFGRVAIQFDDYRRLNGEGSKYVDARGVAIEYAHGQVLAKTEAREGREGQTYYRIVNTNERGQVTEYRKGSVTMLVGYDAKGMLSSIHSKSHVYIQADSYRFDSVGNLIARAQIGMNERTYQYDSLNRVLGVNNVNLFTYSSSGNLEEKSDYRILDTPACNGSNVEIINKWHNTYGENDNPLHALTSRTRLAGPPCNTAPSSIGAAAANHTVDLEVFTYDKNGNETSVTDGVNNIRSITYSARNKAIEIKAKGEAVTFYYDVNNQRYKRTEAHQTIYYVGTLQLTIPNDESKDKVINRYIGNDAQQTYFSTGLSKTKWMFTDHQGSIIAITNSSSKLLKRYAYDIFGKQSEVTETQAEIDAHYANLSTLTVFDSVPNNFKAYTGHEPVTLGGEKRIIHMNGRIYDADTGRFMQADPFVQAPTNLQNYNAYTYVLNNPLSYTDPSGYLFNKIFKKLNKALGDFAPVFGIGLMFIPGMQAWAAKSIWHAAAVGFGIGGVSTGSLKGAIIGGLSGAAFYQVGSHFNTKFKGVDFGKLDLAQQLEWAGSHALVGGITSVASGGKFGHGFVSAGFTKMAMGNAGFNMDNIEPEAIVGRTIVAALIGGTASSLTGGKFANGATTAAMAQLLNAETTNYRKKIAGWRDAERAVVKRLKDEKWNIVPGRVSAKYDGDWYIRGREFDVVAYKDIDGERHWQLIEVKFVRSGRYRAMSYHANRAMGMRAAAQAFTISRQVYFDLNATDMTLTGKYLPGGSVNLRAGDYSISWEFVRPNKTGVNMGINEGKQFTNAILELTGG
ncbi:SpvB/TcaC N-terminal domain-containing protein [Pseudoalteromonas luteoviolacea]|uniref:Insecticide toxin TcdB middle/N-terminal domain-containing protein n=1 Tax=Pseudoalteromonas luteoviolacea S4060-1 TaxID=1365257 RepID=A0A162CL87_9GAMM|nr:SpvB/TcaC N-terminal domain-containing protein [Pseudoalteromonas luteoviolacea]KZN70333.1 hypothetical protein N478_00085 [Pseudoalteromonas luteoviolacea S4060-1]